MPLLGKTKKEVVSQFRCAEILEAARDVFASKGFENATVDDIAEQAGVAKGTLYLYYRSKREMFVAALRQGFEELAAESEHRIARAATARDKVRAFVEARMDFSDRNRHFYRLYYTEYSNVLTSPVRVGKEFQDLYEAQATLLERTLLQGMQSGEVRELNPGAAARLIYDMTRGAIAQRILGWSRRPAREDADFVFDILWRGIGCDQN